MKRLIIPLFFLGLLLTLGGCSSNEPDNWDALDTEVYEQGEMSLPLTGDNEEAQIQSNLKSEHALPGGARCMIYADNRMQIVGGDLEGNLKDSIPENALKDVTAVEIGKGVEKVGADVFSGLGIKSLTIGEDTVSIGERAFFGCTALERVAFGSGVTTFGERCFYGCTALSAVTLPASAATVGAYAFADCSALRDVTISAENAAIGNNAFSGCAKLQTLDMPVSTSSIGDFAFQGCAALQSVSLPEGLQTLGQYAFDGCTSLRAVTLPGSDMLMGMGAFAGCSALNNVVSGVNLAADAFRDCQALTNVVLLDNVTLIGDRAFQGCIKLSSIELGVRITSLGERAFDGCEALGDLELPVSLHEIGDYAFNRCKALQNVHFAENMTLSFGNNAFMDCSALSSLSLSGRSLSLGDNVFQNCTRLTEVSLDNSVHSMGRNLFQGCTQLSTIKVDCETIGEYAFAGCTALNTLEIGLNVKVVGAYAFSKCSNLSSLFFPKDESVDMTKIKKRTDLGQVRGVTEIQREAFSQCEQLQYIVLPVTLKKLGYGIFSGDTKIKTILYRGSVKNDGPDIKWKNIDKDKRWNYGAKLESSYNNLDLKDDHIKRTKKE